MVYHEGMRSWLTVFGTLLARLRLAVRLVRDPAVSGGPKLLPLLALCYLVFPLDFVPDLLPVLGQMDDLGVILIALEAFLHVCPPAVVQYHQAAIAQGRTYEPMPRADAPGPVIDAEFRRDDDRA